MAEIDLNSRRKPRQSEVDDEDDTEDMTTTTPDITLADISSGKMILIVVIQTITMLSNGALSVLTRCIE